MIVSVISLNPCGELAGTITMSPGPTSRLTPPSMPPTELGPVRVRTTAPSVLLGVNSDSDFQTIVRAKAREGLGYRTWWDGSTQGPISTDWNVWGWPSTFILDEDGVILHVNKRGETLIKAVDAVLARTKMGEK